MSVRAQLADPLGRVDRANRAPVLQGFQFSEVHPDGQQSAEVPPLEQKYAPGLPTNEIVPVELHVI